MPEPVAPVARGHPHRAAVVGRDGEIRNLLRLLTTGRSAVLYGEAGAGKSVLADRVLQELHENRVRPVRASTSLVGVPFGSLLTWLDPGFAAAPPTAMELRGRILRAVPPDREGRLILGLSDGHLLDAASADLIYTLVAECHLQLIATIRSREGAPDGLSRLWVTGLAERLEVDRLGEQAVAEMLELRVGGPVSPSATRRMSRLTGGNALLTTELITQLGGDGSLTRTDSGWRWNGLESVSDRLRDAVLNLLGPLEPAQWEVLTLVALTEHLPGIDISELLVSGAESLLERRVLMVADDGRSLMLTRPLYGRVVLAGTPAPALRRFRRRVADLLAGRNRRPGEQAADTDAVAAVLLRVEAGDRAELDRRCAGAAVTAALRAARCEAQESAHLLSRAVRDSRAATEGQKTIASRLLGLSRAGDNRTGLVAVPGPGVPGPGVPSEPPGGAHRPGVPSDASVDRDPPRAAVPASASGPPGLFADAGPAAATIPALVPAMGSMARTLSRAYRERGDGEGARKVLRSDPERMGDLRPPEVADHHIAVAAAAWELGDLLEMSGAIDRAARAADHHELPEARLRCGLIRAEVARAMGDPESAERELRRLETLQRESRATTLRVAVQARLAGCQAEMGDPASAVGALRRARARHRDELATPYDWFALSAETSLVQGHHGDLDGAARTASATAVECRRRDWVARELIALHMLARFGRAEAAMDRAGELRNATPESRLSKLRSLQIDHIVALAVGDAEQLILVSEEFSLLARWSWSVEAMAQAAAVHEGAGCGRKARAARARLTQSVAQHDIRLPSWAEPSELRAGQRARLTSREREIAVLAASGMPNREIATTLTLSVRTVENHLQHAYDKLHVTGRAELADALCDPSPGR